MATLPDQAAVDHGAAVDPVGWFAALVRERWPFAVDLRVAWVIGEAIDPLNSSACLSHRQIGDVVGLPRAAVQRAAKRLERAGFLQVEPRVGPELENRFSLAVPDNADALAGWRNARH